MGFIEPNPVGLLMGQSCQDVGYLISLTPNGTKGTRTKPILITQNTPYKIPQIRSRVRIIFVDKRNDVRTVTLKDDFLKSTFDREQHGFVEGKSFRQSRFVVSRNFPSSGG
jgi:hypothetical protein